MRFLNSIVLDSSLYLSFSTAFEQLVDPPINGVILFAQLDGAWTYENTMKIQKLKHMTLKYLP